LPSLYNVSTKLGPHICTSKNKSRSDIQSITYEQDFDYGIKQKTFTGRKKFRQTELNKTSKRNKAMVLQRAKLQSSNR
jgi:hypothetical protein